LNIVDFIKINSTIKKKEVQGSLYKSPDESQMMIAIITLFETCHANDLFWIIS